MYDGAALDNPCFAELRLVNRGRKDIPSGTFDQEMPLRFDLGISIVRLLRITPIPDELPAPKVNIDGSVIEIGPSLIRKRSEINLVLLADGPEISLTHNNPLIDVKIKPLVQENPRSWHGMNAKTLAGWFAIALVSGG